jgi:hypothetical protein
MSLSGKSGGHKTPLIGEAMKSTVSETSFAQNKKQIEDAIV